MFLGVLNWLPVKSFTGNLVLNFLPNESESSSDDDEDKPGSSSVLDENEDDETSEITEVESSSNDDLDALTLLFFFVFVLLICLDLFKQINYSIQIFYLNLIVKWLPFIIVV